MSAGFDTAGFGNRGTTLPFCIRVIREIRGEFYLDVRFTAAFPRKAFEMRERRVRPPRPDRALKCQRFRISSLAGRTRTFL